MASRKFSLFDGLRGVFVRVHWGVLLLVAGVHAVGLYALSGLERGPTPPADGHGGAITIALLDPPPGPTPADEHRPALAKTADPLPAQPMTTTKPEPKPEPEAGTTGASSDPPAPIPDQNRDRPPVGMSTDRAASTASSSSAVSAQTQAIPARFDAAYLRNPAPPYPAVSRRRGEQGEVVLRVRVLQDGTVEAIEVAQSSGHPRLDRAALQTVRDWRFEAARQGDKALDSWIRVPIVFRLE